MSLKNIIPIYQNFSPALGNNIMTGTNIVLSPPTDILRKDNVSYQLTWTGNPVGSFAVQGSIDYNPGLPQSGGHFNAGTWTTVPVVDQNGAPPTASGSAGQILMDLTEFSFPWIRIQYTNASGAGVLTGYISGKSVGL